MTPDVWFVGDNIPRRYYQLWRWLDARRKEAVNLTGQPEPYSVVCKIRRVGQTNATLFARPCSVISPVFGIVAPSWEEFICSFHPGLYECEFSLSQNSVICSIEFRDWDARSGVYAQVSRGSVYDGQELLIPSFPPESRLAHANFHAHRPEGTEAFCLYLRGIRSEEYEKYCHQRIETAILLDRVLTARERPRVQVKSTFA